MKASLVFVLLVALVAHGVGLRNGFVYDDHRFVVANPSLLEATPAQLLLDPTTHTADLDRDVYRPLRALGHAFDARRWGSEPFGFHLHSLVVHLACVALGLAALARLLPAGSGSAPLLGATVLACHPLGVEAVGWISSRGDLYALALALLALWLAAGTRARVRLVAGALAALLAVLGKESAVWVPLVAWAHQRLVAGESARPRAPVIALAAGAGAGLLLRQHALGWLSPVQTVPHGGDLLAQAGWALYGTGRTIGHLIWPVGLAIEYPQDRWAAAGSPWTTPWPWLTVGALAALVGLTRRRRPVAAWLLAWLLLAYLPSSSLLVTL